MASGPLPDSGQDFVREAEQHGIGNADILKAYYRERKARTSVS